jgi:hypothetical protein
VLVFLCKSYIIQLLQLLDIKFIKNVPDCWLLLLALTLSIPTLLPSAWDNIPTFIRYNKFPFLGGSKRQPSSHFLLQWCSVYLCQPHLFPQFAGAGAKVPSTAMIISVFSFFGEGWGDGKGHADYVSGLSELHHICFMYGWKRLLLLLVLVYRLDDLGSRVRFHHVQNGSGAHPASYPMCTRGSFPGDKAAKEWSWPLTSI